MNCPKCRRHLTYWAALSHPSKKILTYFCVPCSDLYLVTELGDSPIKKVYGGYVVFKRKLTELGYRLPPRSKERKGKGTILSRVPKRRSYLIKGDSLETPDYQAVKEKNRRDKLR